LLAVVLLRGGDPSPTVAAFTSSSPAPEPVAAEPAKPRPGDEILAVVRRHHAAATGGRWDAAFALLSSRKKAEKSEQAAQNGIASGAAQYQSLLESEIQGTLHANRARIRNLEISGHVAQFELAIPRTDGRCYVGTTWAVREADGRWTFDPGYENRSAERRDQPGLETADTSC
jgi:hypothetical protein